VRRSRAIVARLSLLFGLDSFAGGLVVQSFLAYWFATRFGLPAATIGALFFGGSLLSAASFPVAAWLAARIGLVNTMVFTHIPASVLLIGMAISPEVWLASLLYLLRAALSSMDVPTRQSYTMAVVDPEERTATAGVTGFARSVAQAAGPLLAGGLLVPLGLGVPLIASGVLKVSYDLGLFALFRRHPAPGETERPAGRW
jgi:MFS family permease